MLCCMDVCAGCTSTELLLCLRSAVASFETGYLSLAPKLATVIQQEEALTCHCLTCMSVYADRSSKLEQKLALTEEKLQAEQVAHSKLQADVTLERSQAALIKVGWGSWRSSTGMRSL